MKIALKLQKYCIKTGAKRKYNKLINQYFNCALSGQEKMTIEAQIEALKFFLENADFIRLRGLHPELSGVDELSITLIIAEKYHEMTIAFNGKIIQPVWRMHYE